MLKLLIDIKLKLDLLSLFFDFFVLFLKHFETMSKLNNYISFVNNVAGKKR